uniref:subtilisin n=1 Tax=Peronospora matthiolae TaxID=2874970 RepID=A0AAV1TUM4_9STRA
MGALQTTTTTTLLLLLSLARRGAAAAALEASDELLFLDAPSFCAYHCSSALLSPSAHCATPRCSRHRLLQGHEQPQQIDVLSCQDVAQNASALSFALTLATADKAAVFQGFHDAFFHAYDAMLQGASVKSDACQLAFLQDKLLPGSSTHFDILEHEQETGLRARLVTLKATVVEADQDRACVVAIRNVKGLDATAEMPLLTRRGDWLGDNTVLLVHADDWTVEKIQALECVDVVLDLPMILKLMPFARSAAHLSDRMKKQEMGGNASLTAPGLEIRLVQTADPESTLSSFEQQAQKSFGMLNVFETSKNQPRSIFTKPLENLVAWTNVLALAVVSRSVEWIDERHKLTENLLRGEEQERWVRLQSHRRLDAFVPSLIGVDLAREAGIRGNDVVVGITDTGLYLYHDQFDQEDRNVFSGMVMSARKVVMYNAWANRADESETVTCGHGTHVAGILAGSSLSGNYPNFGIADKARIAFMDIGTQSETCAGQVNCPVSLATPADASDLLESQIDAGARIFSFSWGTPGSDYSSQARDLDAFICANPEVLVVVAAGNSGESTITGQRTISSPSGAKNVISVGASLNSASTFVEFACSDIFNERTVASFSSAGPTTDGRMKPDVVAPGMSLISSQSEAPGSTQESVATCSLQGSSQATPVVTGVAVLLYEWLRDGWWKEGRKNSAYSMSTVPASLLKALIIHSGDSLRKRMAALPADGVVSCLSLTSSATDVTFPDVYQGYGKPNLTNIVDFSSFSGNTSRNGSSSGLASLYFLPNSTINSEPAVNHGGEIVISFTVARNVDLRATLVWTDPPGSTQATSQLQHDLDLIVRVRNESRTFGPLTADSRTGRDSINNVEMVLVSYTDLLAAAGGTNQSSSGIGSKANSSALGDNGEIFVEAVVYGRSVLLSDYQKFAFVASSSAIGSTSGSADTSDGKSFWSTWGIAVIVGCAIVLLIIIALATRWCCGQKRKYRSSRHQQEHNSGQDRIAEAAYYPAYEAASCATGASQCPYCPFVSLDAVTMVAHVDSSHASNEPDPVAVLGGSRVYGLEPVVPVVTVTTSPMPPYPTPTEAHSSAEEEKQECPHCRYIAPNAVILVNHVQHMHGH